jgi:hypothetical protein
MSVLRKLALAMLLVFGLTLVAPTTASASSADYKDKQGGEIRVCKVLKDVKYLKDKASFDFVIREKANRGEKDKFKFDITFRKGEQDKKMCKSFSVDKGSFVVREKGMAKGFKLHDIDVKRCYYKDRNDRDAKVVVDVKNKDKCTVTFTNKQEKNRR